MALAIFDLDNTLISGDSDHSWGQFLVSEHRVDPQQFKKTNDNSTLIMSPVVWIFLPIWNFPCSH